MTHQNGEYPTYAIGTWDGADEIQAFTPQMGAGEWYDLRWCELRHVIRRLRELGYGAWRQRNRNGEYDSDPFVLIERVNGRTEEQILEDWKR